MPRYTIKTSQASTKTPDALGLLALRMGSRFELIAHTDAQALNAVSHIFRAEGLNEDEAMTGRFFVDGARVWVEACAEPDTVEVYCCTVNASVAQEPEPSAWRLSCQLPTFFLSSAVQGIKDEAHAEEIANRIARTLADKVAGPEVIETHIAVTKSKVIHWA